MIQMVPRPDNEGIRPALKLLAVACLGGAGLVAWLVLGADDPGGGPRADRGAAGGAASHADGWDPGRDGWRGPSARRSHWSSGGGWSSDGADEPGWLEDDPDRMDPQELAMQRSLGGPDSGVRPQFWPTRRRGRLTSVSGELPVTEGARCDVRVLPVRTATFNCLVKVTCDGIVLYPEPELQAGYVPCEVENDVPVRAVDDGVTHADGDPTVEVDLHEQRVVVTDDRPNGTSFAAELRLDPLIPRRM